MFSFSAPKLALGSENVSSPQTQQPEITGSNQSEPVKLCMPGAEKGLDEIQSSSYQDQGEVLSLEINSKRVKSKAITCYTARDLQFFEEYLLCTDYQKLLNKKQDSLWIGKKLTIGRNNYWIKLVRKV